MVEHPDHSDQLAKSLVNPVVSVPVDVPVVPDVLDALLIFARSASVMSGVIVIRITF